MSAQDTAQLLQRGVFALFGLFVSLALKAFEQQSEIAVVGGVATALFTPVCWQYVAPFFSSSSSDEEEEESDEEEASSDEEVEQVVKTSKKKKKTRNRSAAKKAKRAVKRQAREERERIEAEQRAKDEEQRKLQEEEEKARAAEEAPTTKSKSKKKKKKKKKQQQPVVETVEDEPEAKQPEPEQEWQTQGGYYKSKKAVVADEDDDTPKQTELTLQIASKHYSKIIGKGGETIRILRDRSGAEIQLPKKGALHDFIIITGSKDACELAKTSIEAIARTGYSQLTHPNTTCDSMEVPQKMFPRIMGSKGSTIRALQDTTSTSIELPKRDSGDTTVKIFGTLANVLKAKAALQDLMEKGYSNITHPSWKSLEIPFDQQNVSSLVGKGGSTIQQLQKRYGVQIRTPNASHPGFVVVTGPAENLAGAANEIRMLSVVEEVPMDAAWRGAEAGFDLRALVSWD